MPRLTRSRKYRMQHKAIVALMNEPTIAEAARKTGISESTLELWMREPEFVQMFQDAQKTCLGHGLAKIELNFGKNIQGLQEIADDKSINPNIRATAYGKLIDIAMTVSKQRANAKYTEQLEEEIRRLRGGATVEEIDGEGIDEEETGQTRKAQRIRELPPIGGTVRIDADGGPAFVSDTEGEEEAERDD